LKQRLIIAVDGPSGAGKSTLGRMIARQLNLLYIDTGAMYRAVALAVIESGVSMTDTAKVASIADSARIELAGDPDSLRVALNGRDVTYELRTEQVSHMASTVSVISQVRRTLVERQREISESSADGVVLDGRDIGTVVFPDASVKFFLTAAPEERAHRRYEEDRARAQDVSFEETLADINKRDQRDSTREDSPLVIAADAIVIDSSELSIEEVYARMMSAIHARLDEKPT